MNFNLKNKGQLKSFICLLAVSGSLFFQTSCKKEEKKDTYKVTFTVNANGRFKNGTPKIAYTNASGTTVTEDLSINKEWKKEITGNSSFPIKASITGTIDSADVDLETEAYKNGNLVDLGSSSQSSWSETELKINYESTFE